MGRHAIRNNTNKSVRDSALWKPAASHFAWQWLAITAASLALFIVRFLVPSPVGMADNGDGPRLMCALNVAPVTGSYARYDAYAYFTFDPSRDCAGAQIYPSTEHLLLVAARWLTPMLGLSGTVNLIALGLLTSAIQSAGIASLACGLRIGLRGRLLVAAGIWLVMADAAFFDTYPSPFSEGATLTGLLLVAAGVLYLGRGRLAFVFGLLLTGAGCYLTSLSKEQYLPLVAPICLVLILASGRPDRRPGLARYLTWRTAAALATAGLLAASVLSYAHQDASSRYTQLLHQEQVVDVVFDDIVTQQQGAAADLRALGLPVSWASYAGDGFWAKHSVYYSPLYAQYADKLTDTNLADFLLAHPLTTIEIGQQAANDALALRVTYLGNYAPTAGNGPGALENRVGIVSALAGAVPPRLGLFWLLPLWLVLAAIAWRAMRRGRRSRPWHRDCGIAVLVMLGCAVTAFVPAAFFAGVETTRHMLGSNLATALACALGVTIMASKMRQGVAESTYGTHSRITGPATALPPHREPVPAADGAPL
jgi:hypothetical protein